MTYVRLTAKNQTRLFLDDVERSRRTDFKERTHYSLGEHILLLSQRLDAIEASATGARSSETASARSEGRQSGDAERQRDARPQSRTPAMTESEKMPWTELRELAAAEQSYRISVGMLGAQDAASLELRARLEAAGDKARAALARAIQP